MPTLPTAPSVRRPGRGCTAPFAGSRVFPLSCFVLFCPLCSLTPSSFSHRHHRQSLPWSAGCPVATATLLAPARMCTFTQLQPPSWPARVPSARESCASLPSPYVCVLLCFFVLVYRGWAVMLRRVTRAFRFRVLLTALSFFPPPPFLFRMSCWWPATGMAAFRSSAQPTAHCMPHFPATATGTLT